MEDDPGQRHAGALSPGLEGGGNNAGDIHRQFFVEALKSLAKFFAKAV
jgi:hypothetical protein